MKYKLVAADMDGTLLDSSSRISAGNLEAVKKAESMGIKFAVVSGRSVPSLACFDFIRELKTPAVAYNGSVIYDFQSGKALLDECLEEKDAARLIKMGIERGATIVAWSGDVYYSDKDNERSRRYGKGAGAAPVIFTDGDALAKQGVTKIIWYDDPEKIQGYLKEFENYTFESLNYCTSNPAYLELFNARVSKAKSLEKLGEIYGIKREEMIAVGDGENDLSMLTFAGLGVAMENASDHVKSLCGYVTDTNDNDGVAKLLEKFCFAENDE